MPAGAGDHRADGRGARGTATNAVDPGRIHPIGVEEKVDAHAVGAQADYVVEDPVRVGRHLSPSAGRVPVDLDPEPSPSEAFRARRAAETLLTGMTSAVVPGGTAVPAVTAGLPAFAATVQSLPGGMDGAISPQPQSRETSAAASTDRAPMRILIRPNACPQASAHRMARPASRRARTGVADRDAWIPPSPPQHGRAGSCARHAFR